MEIDIGWILLGLYLKHFTFAACGRGKCYWRRECAIDYNDDKVNKVYRGDVTADLYQNNLSLVIDIVNIVISIPAAEQTDEILVGFLLVKTS